MFLVAAGPLMPRNSATSPYLVLAVEGDELEEMELGEVERIGADLVEVLGLEDVARDRGEDVGLAHQGVEVPPSPLGAVGGWQVIAAGAWVSQ